MQHSRRHTLHAGHHGHTLCRTPWVPHPVYHSPRPHDALGHHAIPVMLYALQIRKHMAQEFRHINTDSDSELLLNVFAEVSSG